MREPQPEYQERESFVEEKRQWSPDFFEKTCGSWEGETFSARTLTRI
ncbi:MAG: hypothetical protein F6K39_13795 [Okeania sp. SIO3B3]|nr:hypothetical protein [Okeania sp. SIO3B3]